MIHFSTCESDHSEIWHFIAMCIEWLITLVSQLWTHVFFADEKAKNWLPLPPKQTSLSFSWIRILWMVNDSRSCRGSVADAVDRQWQSCVQFLLCLIWVTGGVWKASGHSCSFIPDNSLLYMQASPNSLTLEWSVLTLQSAVVSDSYI